jgi:hypothetical protein
LKNRIKPGISPRSNFKIGRFFYRGVEDNHDIFKIDTGCETIQGVEKKRFLRNREKLLQLFIFETLRASPC